MSGLDINSLIQDHLKQDKKRLQVGHESSPSPTQTHKSKKSGKSRASKLALPKIKHHQTIQMPSVERQIQLTVSN